MSMSRMACPRRLNWVQVSATTRPVTQVAEVAVNRLSRGAALIEGAGALLLAIRFIPELGPARGLWYAVFHSVSG